MPVKMTAAQQIWTATAGANTTPNRQDLASYGYNHGVGAMRNITSASWATDIVQDTTYTQSVRDLIHSATPPWGNN